MPGHPNPKETGPMAISMIVELRAKPGRRAELNSRLETVIATQGRDQHGFLGQHTPRGARRRRHARRDRRLGVGRGTEDAHAACRGHRRVRTRARAVGRALQGHGDRAIALTEPVAP